MDAFKWCWFENDNGREVKEFGIMVKRHSLHANSLHPDIKFTSYYGSVVNFLDTLVQIVNFFDHYGLTYESHRCSSVPLPNHQSPTACSL